MTSLYDIHHTFALDTHQRRLLALGITQLHSTAFIASPDSVHVKFTRSMAFGVEDTSDYFVGGKALGACNRILAYLRDEDGARNDEKKSKRLIQSIENLWDSYVCGGKAKEMATLHAVLVLPSVFGDWQEPPWSFEIEKSLDTTKRRNEDFESKTVDAVHFRAGNYGKHSNLSCRDKCFGTDKTNSLIRNVEYTMNQSIVRRLSRKTKFYRV